MKDDTMKDTVLLSGVSKLLSANTPSSTCITINNNSGRDLELLALSFRYKSGLEDVLVSLETPNQKNDPILLGDCALGGIGSPFDAPGYARLHLPGKKPILGQGQNLVVKCQTFGTAINPREINLLVDGQEIKR